jgi:hypothetical protein
MKVLFFCPKYYGIHKIIENGIKENFDCELTTIIFEDYRYKNVFQKIENFISKIVFNKNLKKIWASKYYVKDIKTTDHFDKVLMICPDFLQNDELQFVKNRTNCSIVYYWDSFDNIPRYERTLPYFDKHYSFEKKDCHQFGLQLLTNFFYKTSITTAHEFDVFFIGALDNRIATLIKISDALASRNRKLIIQSKNKRKIEKYSNEGIEFIQNPITFNEAEIYFDKSKVVIDIQKTIQNGLTFRVFEALGRRKKLITTNKDIISYDFYNPNNIFVWEENCEEIPDSFFDTPYEDVDLAILNKYSLNNWIKTILN